MVHLQEQWGELLGSLDQYSAVSRQLERALQFEDWVSAEALSRDLIRRYPQRVGGGNAYVVLATALEEQGQVVDQADQAVDVLMQWHDQGGHEPVMLEKLIIDLRARDRFDDAVIVMESLNWVNPYGTDVHRWLGEHYLDREQPTLALREFDALLGMQVEDLAAAHLGKARANLLMENNAEARREVLYALENAPFYRPAQQLLLALTAGE
jgi:tetratricopeptide (TPR) repeat protein